MLYRRLKITCRWDKTMSEVVPRDQRFGPSGHECEQRLGLLATFEDSMTFAPYEANEPCSTLSYCTLLSGLLPCTGIDRGHGNL